jgi:hypothetical protein
LLLNHLSLHKQRNSFPPYEDLKIPDMLFTSHNTPHITLGNGQCLKLLLGVHKTRQLTTKQQFSLATKLRPEKSCIKIMTILLGRPIKKQVETRKGDKKPTPLFIYLYSLGKDGKVCLAAGVRYEKRYKPDSQNGRY